MNDYTALTMMAVCHGESAKLTFIKYRPFKHTMIGFVLHSQSLYVNVSGYLRLGEFVNIEMYLGNLA